MAGRQPRPAPQGEPDAPSSLLGRPGRVIETHVRLSSNQKVPGALRAAQPQPQPRCITSRPEPGPPSPRSLGLLSTDWHPPGTHNSGPSDTWNHRSPTPAAGCLAPAICPNAPFKPDKSDRRGSPSMPKDSTHPGQLTDAAPRSGAPSPGSHGPRHGHLPVVPQPGQPPLLSCRPHKDVTRATTLVLGGGSPPPMG